MLIHVCEGRALSIVRGAPDHNGFEAWRLLHRWCQPKTRSRGLALLNEILGLDFGSKGATPKDSTIVVVHVDDLLSVGKRESLDNFFVQLAGTLKLKRVEFIDTGKSVLFLGDHVTKYKDRIAYVDNMMVQTGIRSKRRQRAARRTRDRDVSVSRGRSRPPDSQITIQSGLRQRIPSSFRPDALRTKTDESPISFLQLF